MKPQTDVAGAAGVRAIRKIRVKALLFLVLALAAGAATIYLVQWYLARVQGSLAAKAAPTIPVVTAAVNIPVGTPLALQHLSVVQWPASNVPAGTVADAKKVVDRTVTQNIVKGEPILAERLATNSADRGLAALLSKDTRAMAVKVDQVVGIAGWVQPGEFVDVITTMAPDEETRQELKQKAAKVSKIILQNIRVLAIGEQMTSGGAKAVAVPVVTLEVTAEQSEKLALASRHGEIQLTMRSRANQESVPTTGVTPMALLTPDKDAKTEEPKAPPKAPVHYAARPRPKKAEEKKDDKPVQPVVEILRGDRVEERKLRPSADTK